MDELILGPLDINRLPDYESWFDTLTTTDILLKEPAYRDIANRGIQAWTGSLSGKVVSVAFFSANASGHGSIYFAVAPSERRKGIGPKMLTLVLQEPHIRNLVSTKVTVRPENVPAQKVLYKTGFVKIGNSPEGFFEFEKF